MLAETRGDHPPVQPPAQNRVNVRQCPQDLVQHLGIPPRMEIPHPLRPIWNKPGLTDGWIWQVSKTENLLDFGGTRVNREKKKMNMEVNTVVFDELHQAFSEVR